jgi:DNA-directed RNA polymerase specialized sigma24 family protein
MDYKSEASFNVKQNFGLTPQVFEDLLIELLNGNEALFERIFKEHFEKCRTFLVRKLGAESDVAYDITLETLVKFRKNLMLGKVKYGNMAALFTIDARNNYLRYTERENKHVSKSIEPNELNIPVDDVEDYNEDSVNNLKNALSKVGGDCYEILNWHYYLGLPLKVIAEKRMLRRDDKFLNESSVKTKIAECRKKLKTLLS